MSPLNARITRSASGNITFTITMFKHLSEGLITCKSPASPPLYRLDMATDATEKSIKSHKMIGDFYAVQSELWPGPHEKSSTHQTSHSEKSTMYVHGRLPDLSPLQISSSS